MYTLGINAAFHDLSACLVKDGQVIAAVEEERFSRIKHGKRPIPFSAYILPFHAIDFCLQEAGVTLNEMDHVAYSYDPALRLEKLNEPQGFYLPMEPSAHQISGGWNSVWEPLFLSYVINAPRHLTGGIPFGLEKRLSLTHPENPPYCWHFLSHHLSHAASAYYPSPFDEAAVLVIDGQGETASTSYAIGSQNNLEQISQVESPHSLGLLYERVTEFLGFLHSSDEYKVMALASYGMPKYLSIFKEIIQYRQFGQYQIDQKDLRSYFGKERRREEPLTQKHCDIAHSMQRALEETVLEILSWLYQKTKINNLCFAGGVALNCVLNQRIQEQSPFKNIWIQPAAGDAGTALGAALYIDIKSRGETSRPYQMKHTYLGPSFSDKLIESELLQAKISYRRPQDLTASVATLLAANKVVAWFQGKMEFGPRSLGMRSILASPIDPEMTNRLNQIKGREDFRPVAPSILEEEAPHWFVNCQSSPFMQLTFQVQDQKLPSIPAVSHVDASARVQTVSQAENPLFYQLIQCFQRLTGVPLIVNTSFNTRGHPIVCSPLEAIACFYQSPIDALAIGSFLIIKDHYALP